MQFIQNLACNVPDRVLWKQRNGNNRRKIFHSCHIEIILILKLDVIFGKFGKQLVFMKYSKSLAVLKQVLILKTAHSGVKSNDETVAIHPLLLLPRIRSISHK